MSLTYLGGFTRMTPGNDKEINVSLTPSPAQRFS